MVFFDSFMPAVYCMQQSFMCNKRVVYEVQIVVYVTGIYM